MCASGVCLASQDCLNCRADTECANGGRCGSGVCSAPCVSDASCVVGWSCCDGRCVDSRTELTHCGACNAPCSGGAFCGASQCQAPELRNLCLRPVVRVLLDQQGDDDTAGQVMGAAVAASCLPPPSVFIADQDDAGVLHQDGGEPIQSGELLVAAGGSFFQKSVRWLEQQGLAPLLDTSTQDDLRYSLTDGGVVCTRPMSSISDSHDVFVVQLVTAPAGSVVLNAYGYYGLGTAAAAWYFEHEIAPSLGSRAERWFVVEWQDRLDGGLVGQPDALDTWTVLGTGH